MSINASDILSVTRSVTKKWEKQRKAEERGRSRASRAYMHSDRINHTDIAEDILPAAYEHASGGGVHPVTKRQLWYACRESFKEETGRELEYNYFSQTLLVQYMNTHPEAAVWKVVDGERTSLILTTPVTARA